MFISYKGLLEFFAIVNHELVYQLVLITKTTLWVTGGLLVKALDYGSKDPGFPVPLAAEIYFSY